MREIIQDEFTSRDVSKQRKKELRYRRDHLCVTCGKPAAPSTRKGAGGFCKMV
jgi:hypothetical protein